jgi:uncharacterized coiled-coil DUF342 family protein
VVVVFQQHDLSIWLNVKQAHKSMSIREESEESTEQIKPHDHHHHLALAMLISKMDTISDKINDLTNAMVVSTAKTERLAEKVDKIQKTLLKR